MSSLANKTQELIESVRKRPALYDSTHPDYGDQSKRLLQWMAVGREIDESNTVLIRKKWRNIRDSYQKWRRAQSGVGLGRYARLQWAPLLSFLDDTLEHATARGAPRVKRPVTPQRPQAVTPARRCGHGSVAPRARAPPPRPPPRAPPDATAQLMLSYAGTLRRLAPRRAARLKLQLAQLFTQAELEELEESEAHRDRLDPLARQDPLLRGAPDPLAASIVPKCEYNMQIEMQADTF